eukprot:4217995-Amphidinium_carterae.1
MVGAHGQRSCLGLSVGLAQGFVSRFVRRQHLTVQCVGKDDAGSHGPGVTAGLTPAQKKAKKRAEKERAEAESRAQSAAAHVVNGEPLLAAEAVGESLALEEA